MENTLETLEYKGLTIKIYRDDDTPNPRKDWDQFGKMVCAHRRYDLGDEKMDPDDILALTERADVLFLPLYLYDHSGITMNTGGFNEPWDSGQVGIIYATREMIRNEYGGKYLTKAIKKKVYDLLEIEVKTYDQYLTGDVYGYVVGDPEGDEHLDSCWGFYGLDYCIQEAKNIADYYAGERAKEKALEAMENFLDTRPEVIQADERMQAGAV